MRKRWKVLPLAAMATLVVQFSFVGAAQSQLTDGLTDGLTGGLTAGATTGATTTTGATPTTRVGTTGAVAPTPIAVQPRFTG